MRNSTFALLTFALNALERTPDVKFETPPYVLRTFVFVPEQKLMLCVIPKVGSHIIKDFLWHYRMKRYGDMRLKDQPIVKANTALYFNYAPSQIKNELRDTSWKKVVFYREPLERFASAHASKCLGIDKDGYVICKHAFGRKRMSFDEAAAQLLPGRMPGDYHFWPVSEHCGGLRSFLPLYDIVEKLDARTMPDIMDGLMLESGGYEGRRGAKAKEVVDKFFPKAASGPPDTKHHTHAADKLQALYASNETLMRVASFYEHDYDLFGMRPPAWAQARLRELAEIHRSPVLRKLGHMR